MIGDRIKRRRKEMGLTQQELAERLGYVSRVSINQIEKGERGLPKKKILNAAEALNTTVEYLLGFVNDPDPEANKPMAFDTPEDFDLAWYKATQNADGVHHKITYSEDGSVTHEIVGFDHKLVQAYHSAPPKAQFVVRAVLDIDENGDKK